MESSLNVGRVGKNVTELIGTTSSFLSIYHLSSLLPNLDLSDDAPTTANFVDLKNMAGADIYDITSMILKRKRGYFLLLEEILE